MIAPLREPTPRPDRRPTEGERRARKWIVRTLLTTHPPERPTDGDAQRAWAAAAWIAAIAASYVGYILFDLFAHR